MNIEPMRKMSLKEVELSGGPPWGFRVTGGKDTNQPLKISRVNPGSRGSRNGIREGDLITGINGDETEHLTNGEAQQILNRTGPRLTLQLKSAKKLLPFEASDGGGREEEKHKEEEKERKVEEKKVRKKSKKNKKEKVEKEDLNTSYREADQKFKEEIQNISASTSSIPGYCTCGEALINTSSERRGLNGGEMVEDTGSLFEEIISELDELLGSSNFTSTTSLLQGGETPPHLPVPRKNIFLHPSTSVEEVKKEKGEEQPIQPVWTPPGLVSPSTQRKFRPLNFTASTSPKSSRSVSLDRVSSERPEKIVEVDLHSPHTHNGSCEGDQRVNLPKYQSPTVTLLQKAREGQLPKGASYLEPRVQRSTSASGSFGPAQSFTERRTEFQERRNEPLKIEEGIGPTTSSGLPITPRSCIKNESQHEWYKRVFDSLHKDRPTKSDYLTVKYKRKEGGKRLGFGCGSLSEGEGYESDNYGYTRDKYGALDRRKLKDESTYSYFNTPDSSSNFGIRFYPGKIEDYTPGKSSIAARELRRIKPTLKWALGSKDLGYESDSNLVIRKREGYEGSPPPPPLSPAEQRQAYLEIQKGGEVPLQGLRKLPPEKPKDQEGPSRMPTFEESKRSLPSRRSSRSPSSVRSGSPSTVSLLQERITTKLARSHSDIPKKSPSLKPSIAYTTTKTKRKVFEVEEQNEKEKKTRDLSSPKEVKKALLTTTTRDEDGGTTTHKIALKLEVRNATVKKIPKSPKETSEGKIIKKEKTPEKSEIEKNGKKIKSENGKKGSNGKVKKPKTVKISETPKKEETPKREEIEKKDENKSKIPKAISRHAGCLSPSGSRPTSPGALSYRSLSLASSRDSVNSTKRSTENISKIPMKIITDPHILAAKKKALKSTDKERMKRSKSASTLASIKESNHSNENSPNLSLKKRSYSGVNYPEETNMKNYDGNVFGSKEREKSFSQIPRALFPEMRGLTRKREFDLYKCSFQSLPALTPYLKEAKRVSRSAFRLMNNSVHLSLPADPPVRPTKTSLLREKFISESELGTTVQSYSGKKSFNSQMVKRAHSCLGPRDKEAYTKYILEIQNSRRKSPRFVQLHRLYSSLERLGQLERSTSLYDIPILSLDRQLDFDSWWKVRNRTRVDEEIASISSTLSEAQKNKEFFYRPRNKEDFRWRGDSALRIKKLNVGQLQDSICRGREISKMAKDVHKAQWRGNSVKEVALTMEVNALSNYEGEEERERRHYYTRSPWLRRAFSMSSTLSNDERENIKLRLGSLIRESRRSKHEKMIEGKGEVTRRVTTSRMGTSTSGSGLYRTDSGRIVKGDGGVSESFKREMYRTLSVEFKEKRDSNELLSKGPKSNIPISTQILLKKQEEQLNKKNLIKSPPYSLYSQQKVPTKVEFFEKKKQSNVGRWEENEKRRAGSQSRSILKTRGGEEVKRSRSVSPTKDLDYISHVNLISRVAAFLLKKDSSLKNLVSRELFERDKIERLRLSNAGEVDRLKYFFEAAREEDELNSREISLLRCLFCSDPNLSGIDGLSSSTHSIHQFHDKRRCASADVFNSSGKKNWNSEFDGARGRRRPDGRESSPSETPTPQKIPPILNSPAASDYLSSRSRKVIYHPSSTPNVCQPTLTAHCYLDSPPKSSLLDLTAESNYNSSEYSIGGTTGVEYGSYSQSAGSCYSQSFSPSPPYFNTIPPRQRILDVRTLPLKNYDPSLHQPKYRYVPEASDIGKPPMVPPPPRSYSSLQHPYLYRSVRYLYPRNLHEEEKRKGDKGESVVKGGPRLFRGLPKSSSFSSNDKQSHYLQSYSYKPLPSPSHQTSPLKYAETEVNIHYKAPVRIEEKDFISEDELKRRQEILMKKFYEEQRHRKFIQEIQDMENRRHTDNFTPSQKSPIPLGRYEDVFEEPSKPKWREKTPDKKMAARALYSFIAQNPRELSFHKGDVLFIRKKLDGNWYEGEHNAAVGIFPTSYVEILSSYEGDRATPKLPSEGQAKVQFNFTAASPAEMSIIKGETIVLTRRVDCNWYEGRIGSRRGIFPASYVHVMKEPGSDLRATLSPKPIGSPAAHSLSSLDSSQHQYTFMPNQYSLNRTNNTQQSFNSQRDLAYMKGMNNSSGAIRRTNGMGNGRRENLTIDTRSDPMMYRSLYNYRPAHEDELELHEGDLIHVLEKCDDGWFVGTSQRTGHFGTFPGNYVERA